MSDVVEGLRDQRIASGADALRFLFLLDGFPFVLDSLRAGLEARRSRGYVAPRAAVRSGAAYLRALRDLDADAPWLLAPDRLTALDSAVRVHVLEENKDAIAHRLLPALDSLIAFLEGPYFAAAPARLGLWQYPGGKEYYRYLVRRHSSLNITPDDAHRIGLGALRSSDSLLGAARRGNRWNPSASAFLDSLRRRVRQDPTEAGTPAARIAEAERRVTTGLRTQFSAIPPFTVRIRSATPLEQQVAPDGELTPPSATDSVWTLAVTPRWTAAAGAPTLDVRAYGALVPGRQLQRWSADHAAGISPIRRLIETAGYTDGWRQYAAALVAELGGYPNPLSAYAALLEDAFHAALLVVDTGIHYLGWTRAQAIAVLRRYSLENEATLDSILTERIVGEPGRATAATLGARELFGMRDWLQQSLGDHFDRRAWHDELLSLGSLPLPIVGSHMQWWRYEQHRRDTAPHAAHK